MRHIVIALALVSCAGSEAEAPVAAHVEEESSGGAEEEEEFAFDDEGDDGEGSAEDDADPKAKVEASVAATRTAMDAERLASDQRKAAVEAAASELETRLKTIGELERRLDERLGQGATAQGRRSERIAVLAKLIMSMAPQSGATMVGQMTDADAQSLILWMSQENERKASKLLSALPGDRAAQLGQLYLDKDPKTLEVPDDAPPAPPPEAPKPEPEPEDDSE